jgi:hypothetical protein
MAEDAIALLDYLKWTEKRELHVVGISLGGMIAQGERRVPFIWIDSCALTRACNPYTGQNNISHSGCYNARRCSVDKFSSSKISHGLYMQLMY